MDITVKSKYGLPSINGMICSYENKKIREEIESFFKVNKEFILPKKYTYLVTEINCYAKILKSNLKIGLEKYYGKSFIFAEEFTCTIEKDGVWIEEYMEGDFQLKHIKTEEQLIELYEILTGNIFDINSL